MKTVKFGLYYSEVLNSVEVAEEIYLRAEYTDADIESIAKPLYENLSFDQIVALDEETAEWNDHLDDFNFKFPAMSQYEYFKNLVEEAIEMGEVTM